jgi:mandelamide amidase
MVRADVSNEIRAGTDLTRTIHLYETAANMSAFLEEQEAGVTLDDLVAQMGPDLQPLFRDRIVPGAPHAVTREQYDAAVAGLGALREAIRRYFADHDVRAMAFPASRIPPPAIGEDTEVEVDGRGGRRVSLRAAIGRNLGQGSCAGMPCLVLPAGMSSAGLPIGIEFDAMPGQDRELLALGLSLEKALGPIPAPGI